MGRVNYILAFLIFFLFFLFLSSPTFAQSPLIQADQLNGKFHTNNVYSSLSDSKGFLWFTTDLGIYKYNGQTVQHIGSKENITDLEVFGMFEDHLHRIWLRTLNGKLGYYQNGSIIKVDNDSCVECALSSWVSSIVEIDEDVIIASRGGKILRFKDNQLSLVQNLDSLSVHDAITYNGELLLFTQKGIYSLNISGKDTLQLLFPIRPSDNFRVNSTPKVVYFSNNTELYSMEVKSQIIKRIDSLSSTIISIKSIDESLWVGTRRGAYEYNSSIKEPNMVLENMEVSSVNIDFEGGLWFTTLNNGVFYKSNTLIECLYSSNSNQPVGAISSFSWFNNELWIGRNSGNFEYGELPTLISDRAALKSDQPIEKFRFIDNDCYILTGANIIKLVRQKNGVMKRKYFRFSANDLVKHNDSYLIAGNALLKIDSDTFDASFSDNESIFVQDVKTEVIVNKRTNCLIQMENGRTFAGTRQGLFELIESAAVEQKFKDKSFQTIVDLDENDNGDLIISTATNGLFILKENGTWINKRLNEGLGSPNCLQTAVHGNEIWTMTLNGISRISIDHSNQVSIQDVSDINNTVNERITRINFYDDQFVFGTATTLNTLTRLKINQSPPRIDLTQVMVNGHNVKLVPTTLSGGLNSISFSFEAISYQDQSDFVYEYMLNGFHQNWQSSISGDVNFESISHGEYQFNVRVRNGEVLSEISTYEFKVSQVFYKTYWFILCVIIFCLAISTLLIKYRIKKIRKRFVIDKMKINLETEVKELEQKALRLQMNPHFIFNALNTIKGYYSSNDLTKANEYISKFSKMLRLILEHEDSTITLSKEKQHLELYLDLIMLRYATSFEFTFQTDEEINSDTVIIPSMLLQPFVENAVIHGIAPNLKDGIISISIQRNNDLLICSICNNGQGRLSKNVFEMDENRVNSTSIVKRRLEIIEQENKGKAKFEIIDHSQNKNISTEVLITIPFKEQW